MLLKRASLALLFTSFLSIVAAAEGQRVILVLDASGSMWAQINGVSKMDIARDVVGKVLGKWKPEDDLGLVVYGHREKGSCTDIETVLPPRPLDVAQFMSPIKSLVPKGKTPMTQAVRQAAEALKYTEQKGTVILVSDGQETCEADPCAVARELEKNGIGFTVHTVGFGLDNKTAVAQLKCIAQETGGIAVLADNAEELEAAMTQTVEAKVEEPPPPAPPPVDVKDFEGRTYMAEGVELPKPFDAVTWVFNIDQNGAEGEYLSTEYGKDVKVDMAKSGDYFATVSTDLAKVQVPFKHEEGKPSKLDVTLNAGIVSFQGMMDESTALPKEGPTWTFAKADGTYYGTSYGATPKNLFNAGDYKAKLSMGSAEVEVAFAVKAGETKDMVVLLGSGLARVTATYSQDGEAVPDGTAIELRKAADISGKKKWVATDYGNNKLFQAPAGDYVIVVKLNLAEAEVPIKIIAGQEVPVKVNLNAGFIAAKSASATRIEIYGAEVGINGKRKWLGTEYGTELNYAANAGSYHVVAVSTEDAIIAEKDIVVEAGKRLEVTLP